MDMDEALKKVDNLRFENIKITRLFNKFDYNINFSDKEDLAILYGLNGIGKTTILKIINWFCFCIFEKIFELKFEQIVFSFNSSELNSINFTAILENSKQKKITFDFSSSEFKLTQSYNDIPELSAILSVIREIRTSEYIEYGSIVKGPEISCDEPHDFFGSLLSKFNCLYIESLRNNIKNFDKFGQFYKEKKKLMKRMKKEEKKLKKQIRRFEVEPLGEIEILNDLMEFFFEEKLESVSESFVYIYFHNIYDEFKKEIELYIDFINPLMDFKEIRIDKEGLHCILEDGAPLPLSNLSSGEKNIIIILHEILIEAHDKSLILLDEPEISLNINWLYEFIEFLKKVQELKNFQYLIATHSPQFVNIYTQNCVDTISLNEQRDLDRND